VGNRNFLFTPRGLAFGGVVLFDVHHPLVGGSER
jgi:hypothetical protein